MPFQLKQISVLLVSSDPQEIHLVREVISRAEDLVVEYTQVNSMLDAVEHVTRHPVDAVLVDLDLPDCKGTSCYTRISAASPSSAILILADPRNERAAMKFVRDGAQDYLIKDDLHGTLIVRALRYAIEHKRASDVLRATEERYREIFEQSRDGIIVANVDGDVVDANQAAAEIFGYPREELLEKNSDDLYTSTRDGERLLTTLESAGSVIDYEAQTVRPDGTSADLLISATLRYAPDGTVAGSQASVREITAWKAAAASLHASEQMYRLQARLLDAVGQAVIATSLDGTITYWNRAAVSLYGWTPREVIGQDIAQVLSLDYSEIVTAEIIECMMRGEAWSGEYPLRRRDGTTFPAFITNSPIFDDDRAVIGFIGVSTDISERKRAEQALREATERFSATVEVSPLPIIVVDQHNIVQLWNAAAERTFGWRKDEVLGRMNPLTPDGGPDDEIADNINATLESSPVVGKEQRRVAKDGRVVQVRLWTAALPEDQGERFSVLGVFADMTEQRRLEEQFRQSQKMEAMGRLAGGVAHDFNNILTAIGGHLALVLDDVSQDDPMRADLVEIRKGVDRAAALTRQLLAFSRHQVLQPKVLDLNNTVLELERMLRRLIGEDVVLRTETAPTPMTVIADQGQMEQLLVNLVVNARDAMPEGGNITVTTRKTHLPDGDFARQAAIAPGPYVMLTVSDTGFGMDRETSRRIFEPFFTTKQPGKGTGLGLSTVYGIVKQSGGEIIVSTEPGKGSVFTVYLPATDEEPDVARTFEFGDIVKGSGLILVVEDEQSVRGLIRRVLKKRGYQVIEAGSPDEALLEFGDHWNSIDLLLTDVVMPGIGGPQLAERIREIRPDVPVIFMSGYTGETLGSVAASDPGSMFIEKPFTPEALLHAVQRALGSKSSN